jgi:hypothetical protein
MWSEINSPWHWKLMRSLYVLCCLCYCLTVLSPWSWRHVEHEVCTFAYPDLCCYSWLLY